MNDKEPIDIAKEAYQTLDSHYRSLPLDQIPADDFSSMMDALNHRIHTHDEGDINKSSGIKDRVSNFLGRVVSRP